MATGPVELLANFEVPFESGHDPVPVVSHHCVHICAAGYSNDYGRRKNRFPGGVSCAVTAKRIEADGSRSTRQPSRLTQRFGNSRMGRKFTQDVDDIRNLRCYQAALAEQGLRGISHRKKPA